MADYDMNGQSTEDCDLEDEKMESETVENPIDEDDEDDRKLFIGGLNWNTKEEGLRKFCEQYGEVLKCDLKTNINTRVSRCFAFVVFKDVPSVQKFLACEKHELDGKIIDPKLANKQEDATKIFIGGLSTEATDEEIRTHFEQFGTITEISVPVDSDNKRKPFAFIVFSTRAAVAKATKERMHTIHDKECEVKKSVPKGAGRGRGFGGRGRVGFSRGGGYQPYGGYYGQGGYGGYGGYGSGYDYYGYGHGHGYGGYGQGGWGWGGYDQGYSSYDQSSFGKTRGRGGRGYKPY